LVGACEKQARGFLGGALRCLACSESPSQKKKKKKNAVLSSTMPQIRTKLTEMLGVEHPIMLAGMGGIAGKELVAAVANAGGFGTLGAAVNIANQGPEELRAELAELRRMCNGKPFGVDILVHGAEGGVMQQLIDVFADEGARAFISGRGFPRREVIERFHKRGMLVGSIAGRLIHAVRAVEEGVDFIIVQGTEVSVALWIP
jgi:enoyl-[acyl-carrier protein] reductase II